MVFPMSYGIVKDQAYRQRKKQRPPLPKTLEEVDIIKNYPDLVTTKKGQPFYRGKTESGGELFMTDKQIEMASASNSLFLDGTFSICPEPFYQVMFMTGVVDDNTYLIATAILPNKEQITYQQILTKMRDVCQEKGLPLDFAFVHSDCEQAILNAVKAVFPEAQQRVCRFHVSDAML